MRCIIESPEAMLALGDLFGRRAAGGQVYCLDGPLGAGKTQWAKGFGRGLGATSIVNSPTFTIVKEHLGRLKLHHVDLYRINSEQECFDLALEDLITPESVLVIEWSSRCSSLRPLQTVALEFDMGVNELERVVTVKGDLDQVALRNIPGLRLL